MSDDLAGITESPEARAPGNRLRIHRGAPLARGRLSAFRGLTQQPDIPGHTRRGAPAGARRQRRGERPGLRPPGEAPHVRGGEPPSDEEGGGRRDRPDRRAMGGEAPEQAQRRGKPLGRQRVFSPIRTGGGSARGAGAGLLRRLPHLSRRSALRRLRRVRIPQRPGLFRPTRSCCTSPLPGATPGVSPRRERGEVCRHQLIRVFDVRRDGSLGNNRVFAEMFSAEDGVPRRDEGGPCGARLLHRFGGVLGIRARRRARRHYPAAGGPRPTALGAGPENRTMFFTARSSVYAMRMKTPGARFPALDESG